MFSKIDYCQYVNYMDKNNAYNIIYLHDACSAFKKSVRYS